ncbi:MAG: DUF934 domain-containing protein [Rhodobacteraceae bacterium]|nr:DUF934 domain-containing protein [Paracoccaceae bacterium]
MSKIFANGAMRDEDWYVLEPDAELPSGGKVVVPMKRFLETPDVFLNSNHDLQVLVEPGDNVLDLQPHLSSVAVIGVSFQKFADGRGFTSARILRERLEFAGDIRAVGDFILDQVPLLRRCGVTSFQTTKPEVLKALADGEWPEVTNYLQPVGTVDEVPAGTRPWARKSLVEGTLKVS